MPENDRKMFAPMRRGDIRSPAAKLSAIIATHPGGMTAAALTAELGRAGLAVGARSSVTSRIAELLDGLEEAGQVERIPDGRYRVVRGARPATSATDVRGPGTPTRTAPSP